MTKKVFFVHIFKQKKLTPWFHIIKKEILRKIICKCSFFPLTSSVKLFASISEQSLHITTALCQMPLQMKTAAHL